MREPDETWFPEDGERVTDVVIVGDEVVVLGVPAEPEDEETGHNCDAMGCGQSHVLWRHTIPARLASPVAQEAAGIDVEYELRKHWWLGHGHHGVYGDDGEMQCSECHEAGFGVWDYKRAPLDEVRATFLNAQRSRLSVAQEAGDATSVASGEREVDRLRRFAAWVMAQHTGSIDGCEIEEEAVALGLMECVRCDGSCEDCCGSIPGEDNCYRPLLSAAPIPGEEGGKP